MRKTNENEPIEDASLTSHSVVETRSVKHFWDKSVRRLMTGQTATGVKRA